MRRNTIPEDFTPDSLAWPMLTDLLEHLEQSLNACNLNNLCMIYLAPGDTIDPLGIEPGVAYVRMVTAFPSASFPSAEVGGTSCHAPLAVGMEMGIVRCIEVPERKRMPAVDSATYTSLQMADMGAMRRAAMRLAQGDYQVALGSYLPYGPEGGLYGGAFSLTGMRN